MGRAFFKSLQSNNPDVEVTAVDPSPNATKPNPTRILIQAAEAGHDTMRRRLHLYATVTGSTTSVDGQVWIKDAAGAWLAFGAAITTLAGTIQVVDDLPAGVDVFFQVTALNGASDGATPRLLAA